MSGKAAASSNHAGWVRLTPYLTLKQHVSKHTQLCNVITQHYNVVPYIILTDRAQRAHNWWRKMPYISVLWKYLPECCVIKNMHKKLNIWGHPLAIASNCSIVSSANGFPARSCLVCTMFSYIMLHIVTKRHKRHIWNLLIMSFQMRYNLSILNNLNYQNLTHDLYQPDLADRVCTTNLFPFSFFLFVFFYLPYFISYFTLYLQDLSRKAPWWNLYTD